MGLMLVTGLAGGCASIPKEAPTLSAELGQRLTAFEAAHVTMLRAYMDEKRDRLDEFLVREWVPTFAEELMSQDVIKATWEQAAAGTAEDRLQFLVKVGPVLQSRINKKRLELMAPIDELESQVERRLRDDYLQAHAINNALTSFLVSASEVDENRNRLLSLVGVGQDDVAQALDDADDAISTLVKLRDKTADKVQDFETFKAKIKAAIAKLSKATKETSHAD
jgi:hypothetical protein